MVVPVGRAEPNHVGEQYGAVLPGQQAAPRLTGRTGQGVGQRERVRQSIRAAPGLLLGEPLVDLSLDDVEHPGVGVDEAGEVRGLHDQGVYRPERGDAGGADALAQRAALAYQLSRAALGDDPLPALVSHGDARPARENDHYMVGKRAFLHNSGTARERLLLGHGNEGLSLGLIEGIEKAHVA